MIDSALAHSRDFFTALPGMTVKKMALGGGMKWKCLEQGWLKLNTDASVRAGCGANIRRVLCDMNGYVVWYFSERCCTFDLRVVEAIAIQCGLQYTRDQGVRDLEVESDA